MQEPLEHELERLLTACESSCQYRILSGVEVAMTKARILFLDEVRFSRISTIFPRWLGFAVDTSEEAYGPEITRAQIGMAKFLIEIGMRLDPTAEKTARDLAEKARNTELLDHITFVKNIMECDARPEAFLEIKAHLEKEGVTVDPTSIKTWSLFHSAVHHSHIPPYFINIDKDGKDWTEVKNAVAKLVVEKGLHVNARNAGRGTHQETPLILAANAGNLVITQYLVDEKKAKVNVVGSNGRTPLSCAQENEDPAVASYLKSKGAKLAVKRSKHMATDNPVLAPAHPQPPATQPKGLLSRLFSKKH